ncbi:hypothetical protein S7711_11511, partial [Stachybotrys chartarum IBT 7711]
RYY